MHGLTGVYTVQRHHAEPPWRYVPGLGPMVPEGGFDPRGEPVMGNPEGIPPDARKKWGGSFHRPTQPTPGAKAKHGWGHGRGHSHGKRRRFLA